ncbi:MBL fold metallo-hydrolase [Candidatus Sumerlaeota bacterium]|nr:MBL fold metallo-hydrolase [Candidatus Sumerlaeota bacterium]
MRDRIEIAILVDNQAGEGLVSEHGLSLWIEAGSKRILFDTGQGSALSGNAKLIGVALEKTRILVLSHGHYDHTGGIPDVLGMAPDAEVYCHPGAVQPRYSIRDNAPRPIQIPQEALARLNRHPSRRVHWVSQPLTLSDKIGLTGPVPRETDFEDAGGPFYLDPDGERPDPIEDDQSLWISTPEGLIVCLGCCHAGLVNTLDHIVRITGESRIRAIIGGMHLLNADARRLEATVAALRSFSPNWVFPCHCTGEPAVQSLKTALGSRVVPARSGEKYEFYSASQ